MTIELSLLGQFSLTLDGQAVELKNRKARALLAYLAMTPGQSRSREKLAGLLWGERFEEQARASLRQALHALRRALGPEVVKGEGDLMVPAGAIAVDALAYDRGETPDWTGELLAGFSTGEAGFDEWLEVESGRVQRSATAAFHAATDLADDDTEKLRLAEQALAADPFDEVALRLAMAALSGQGRRAEALARHAAFSDRLKRELDAAAGEETTRLAAAIQATGAKAQPAEATVAPTSGALGRLLVGPVADLGGGDTATFLASELRSVAVAAYGRFGNVVVRKLPESSADRDPGDVASILALHDSGYFWSASVRQLGDSLRVAFRIEDNSGGAPLWSHAEVIASASVFDFLDGIGQFLRGGFLIARRALHRLIGAGLAEGVEILRSLADEPSAFVEQYNLLFWPGFEENHTRLGLTQLGALNDYARSVLPRDPLILVGTGFQRFHLAHLGDGKDRVAAYEAALDYTRQALAIRPDLPPALASKLTASIWLGRFADVDAVWRQIRSMTAPITSALFIVSLVFRGRNAEAIDGIRSALTTEAGSPMLVYRYPIIGLAQFNMGDFDEALSSADAALTLSKEFFLPHLLKIAALQRLGRADAAAAAIADFRENYRDPTVAEFEFLPFTEDAPREAFFGALREAGLP